MQSCIIYVNNNNFDMLPILENTRLHKRKKKEKK